ncbi:ribonuclease III [Metamycoplasma equirhinis]|uniref:ribonuclease III n=1 Tax=Metamycoplasma equirhinis TaxID=92402 RepID=UPI00359360A7
MSSEFENNIKNFLIKCNIKPNKLSKDNLEIFYQAFTHKTYSNENKGTKNYQYLEFLGDAVLQFTISEIIYHKFPNYDEGKATALRASIVDQNNLGNLANAMGLPQLVRSSKNAFINGRNIKSESDVLEAFIGALHLVYGYEFVLSFIYNLFLQDLENHSIMNLKDPKTLLQEYVQLSGTNTIKYETFATDNSLFKSEVYVNGMKYGSGMGNSKKEAEKLAATDALNKLKN